MSGAELDSIMRRTPSSMLDKRHAQPQLSKPAKDNREDLEKKSETTEIER